jgi:two-component system LytT family sensor kinase
MRIQQLLFSEPFAYRIARHVSFWFVFCLYIFFFRYERYDYTLLFDLRTYGIRFQNVIVFLLEAIPGTLFSLRYIVPNLLKGKTGSVTLAVICLGLFFSAYVWLVIQFSDFLLLPGVRLRDASRFDKLAFAIYNGVLNPFLAAGFAVSVKLMKSWYLQMQEILETSRRKLAIDLHLLKMKFHPQLLVGSIHQLRDCLESDKSHFPELLIGISDVLSYALYETNEDLVSLEKEIMITRTYIESQRIMLHERIRMTIRTSGNFLHQFIAPMILIPIIQCAFGSGTAGLETGSFDLDIEGNDGLFIFKMTMLSENHFAPGVFQKIIGDTQLTDRLQAVYPGKHEFQIEEEDQGRNMTVRLLIHLSGNVSNQFKILSV